ncbi:carboxypeptidase-like regulatory domain-containing protein [Roseivirga misakiensis]|uniref:Carboxypeptidase-like regulatory domain-containing protein n=1 Tax=Roseivirga misakiensis TaxID=1563681 RepID=A0A1E5SL04_9BACT|nr:carboxypeptidase-like regulatory domain-containing protein [Roseivirga misakiensis]OEJ99802.1 hypothetical protein BFP71_09580 [Roseivirga misakiensis]
MKNRALFVVTFLIVVLAEATVAQTEFLLKGSVIDSSTGGGLPFATIAYPKKSLGTTSDQDGNFQFFIPNALPSDSIVISFLGFKKRSIVIGEFEANKAYELIPEAKDLASVSVVANPKKFKLKPFMRQVIKTFNGNKNSDSHIAYAQYREMAFQNNEPIMYMESIGYSIYSTNKRWATYANYNFINEQTRAFVNDPTWFAYGENLGSITNDGVFSSGRSILRSYRVLETRGVLAENRFNKYRFKLDSSYVESNNEVLVIQFNSANDKGKLFVNSDNYQIQKIVYNSNYIWSNPFHRNLRADIHLSFTYINEVPYLKFGHVEYLRDGLRHITELQTLLQKDANLKLDDNLFGLVNAYGQNPIVVYDQDFWSSSTFSFDNAACTACTLIDLERLKPQFQKFTNRILVTGVNELTAKQKSDQQLIFDLIDRFR